MSYNNRYLIVTADVFKTVSLHRFADAEARDIYTEKHLSEKDAAYSVDDQSSLLDRKIFSTNVMLDLFNALSPETPVKRFATREDSERRVGLVLQTKFKDLPVVTADTLRAPVPSTMKGKTTMKHHEGEHPDHGTTADDKAAAAKAAKAAKKAAAKSVEPAGEKKPGVIAALIAKLKDGGGTVQELFEHLKTVFPDRGDGMLTTVKVQLQALPKRDKNPIMITKTKAEGESMRYEIVE